MTFYSYDVRLNVEHNGAGFVEISIIFVMLRNLLFDKSLGLGTHTHTQITHRSMGLARCHVRPHVA